MNREYRLKIIIEELTKLKVIIDVENKLNLTDKNIFLEDLMCQIINIIYNYSLKNTNFYISNYPCIDLIDIDQNVGIQVTTNVKRDKIQNSLNKFFENNYDAKIKKLRFIVFADTSYRNEFVTQREFDFKREDIITFKDLINIIKGLEESKLNELYEFIEVSLVKNIYTTNWMIENTNKSLTNLGKRYNKKLNVYNEEEEKLKSFLLEKEIFQKISDSIFELIIKIENNGVYTGLKIENLMNKSSFEFLEETISKLDKCKTEVLSKMKVYNERNEFQKYYDKRLEKIRFYVDISMKKALIYMGDAGIGKSHTLANYIYNYYISKNKPAILLLGHDFVSKENIEIQIAKNMGCVDNLKTICTYINNIAISKDMIIPIVIDGINESEDKSIWKRGINNLVKTITQYSNLKLILSIRKTYYSICVPEEINENLSLKIINHDGFGKRTFEAAKDFFEFYDIPIPITQIINSEFSNPLFLMVYCEIVSKYKIKIDEFKYDNFVNIYDEYLQRINEDLLHKYSILGKVNIVKKCLDAIVKSHIDGKQDNSYEKILASIQDVAELYDIKKTNLLNELIDTGILYKEVIEEKEILIFTYERYEKIAKAQYLLNEINEVEELKAQVNKGKLHNYFDASEVFDKGILEELLIIIPMKYKIDVFSIINIENIRAKHYVIRGYIDSLIWLKKYYDSNIILNNLYSFLGDDYGEYILDRLIKCSYISTNPCNVNVIHNYLIKMNMVELDYKWTILLENYYEYSRHQTVDNIIEYCLKYGNEFLNDDTNYLISKVLSWFLSSNNRGIRDKATKALTRILVNKNSICIKIINDFRNVKDLYVLERIIAAIYGAVIRSDMNDNIIELANIFYEVVYKGNTTLDNIVIKIYARKFFKFLKVKFDIDLFDKINGERKSEWYKSLPTNEEIDEAYRFNFEECMKDRKKFSNSRIIDSMVTEYGRGICTYGDFGRYTLQPMLEPFEHIFGDIQLLANIATKRVFEYGYDFNLFGEYDDNIKMNETRNINYVERIGKKYQWIAVYELLAKLYDNYIPHYRVDNDRNIKFNERKYYDENHIETQNITQVSFAQYFLDEEYPHVLCLDTTNFLLKQNENNYYLYEKEFCFEEEDYRPYLTKEFDGKKYISLFNLFAKENRKITSKVINRKSFTLSQTAVVYEKKEKLLESNFHNFSQGRYIEIFNIDLFEISFSGKSLLKEWYDKEYYDIKNGYKACYRQYVWERYQDESIENSISVLLPAQWIIDELKLVQKSEGRWYNGEELICFDGNVEDVGSGLWIRYDYFFKYLDENNLNLAWTIFSEKTDGKRHKNWRSDVFVDRNLKNFEVTNYQKEEWESTIHI